MNIKFVNCSSHKSMSNTKEMCFLCWILFPQKSIYIAPICACRSIGNHGPIMMLGNGLIYKLYELLLSSNVNFVKGVFADICFNGENNNWEWVTIAKLLIELLTMFSSGATTKTTLIAKLWETRSMLLILQRFFENRNTFCLNQN